MKLMNLDSREEIAKIDSANVYESTLKFPEQCAQAWKEASNINFPEEYKSVKNVVVCGMGGSRFTPITIKEAFRDNIRLSYEIVDDYTLPSYVNNKSLVILSSYSGTTEEVLACSKQALDRGAKISGITEGGELRAFLEEKKLPCYIFKPIHNPAGQPRVGSGYMLMGHLGILFSLGMVDLAPNSIKESIVFAREVVKNYVVEVADKRNSSKELAKALLDKNIFLVAAEHLRGFANGFANQINETAKMISSYRFISELNHHLMEGLKRPESLQKDGMFLFVKSKLYDARIQKRFEITKDVVNQQGLKTYEIYLKGTSKFSQVLEAFTLSGFTTLYMALLYEDDPVKIPWVDYFKEKLGSF